MTSKRTDVLVTGPTLGKQQAGIATHIELLTRAMELSQYRLVHYAVTPATYREPWARKTVRVAARLALFPAAARRAQLVHINSTIDSRSIFRDCAFVAVASAMRRPVVFQFHGGDVARLLWRSNRLAHAVVARVLGLTRSVLVLSEPQLLGLVSLFPHLKYQLVKNGVPIPPMPDRNERAGLRILFLARLDEEKGVLETIRGFAMAGLRDATLAVAGAGPLEEAVSRECAATPGAVFKSYVAGVEKAALLDWADVLVLPSIREGLPYSLLEGAADGLALIGTAKGAVTSIVKDGENGFVIAPLDADAIAEKLGLLDSDRQLLRSMQTASRVLAEKEFSLDALAGTFTKLYGEALQAHARNRL
jgi:glycosyltransferase involved in cell wall biosynthesis